MQNVTEKIAEMTQLDWFVGEWDIQSRMLMNPETEQWVDDTCASTITKVAGGHGLLETFDGTINGEAFNGISLRTFNKTFGKWQQRWLDNNTPAFWPILANGMANTLPATATSVLNHRKKVDATNWSESVRFFTTSKPTAFHGSWNAAATVAKHGASSGC